LILPACGVGDRRAAVVVGECPAAQRLRKPPSTSLRLVPLPVPGRSVSC
jgi:hypothetical protein